MMYDALTCFYKDFKFYFASRIIYLLLALYILISVGLTFWGTDFYNDSTINLQQFFANQPLVFAIIIPALTMRSIADEYRDHTLEIIMAQPISRLAFVLGKFMAAWAICGVMLIASMSFWFLLSFWLALDNFWILWCYVAAWIASGTLCALSLLAASFFAHMLSAFALSLAVCFLLTNLNLGWIGGLFTQHSLLALKIAGSFSFAAQYDNMISGQISLSSLMYFASTTAAFVWLTGAVLDYKRR